VTTKRALDEFEGKSPFQRVGFLSSSGRVAPVAEHTASFEAGNLTIRVETRPDPAPGEPRGPSILVCASGSWDERLRFDLIDGTLHYHYVAPEGVDRVVVYDEAACGPMLDWVGGCLEGRLATMLRRAGADILADGMDADAVRSVVPAVLDLARPQVTT